MKITDTLILEDKMSQTLKAVSAALEDSNKTAKVASENLEKLKNTEGATAKEISKATKEWAKQSNESLRLQQKLMSLENAQEKLNDEMNKTSQIANKSQGAMIALGSAVGLVAANLLMKAGEFLKNSIGEAIKTASDLVEVQNVVDTVFQDSAESINKWSKTALKQYGLNELSAKQFAGTVGAMMKSSGISGQELEKMSTTLAGLAGDMSSFYNLDPTEAFAKIRAGISGESEPLKQIGVDLTETALKSTALAMGINKSTTKMTQSEKIMIRYYSLLQQTSFAQGDFYDTQFTFANQQRILTENWKRLTSTIASGTLPILTKLYAIINNIIDSILKLVDKIQQSKNAMGLLIVSVSFLTAAIVAYGTQALIAGGKAAIAFLATESAARTSLLAWLKVIAIVTLVIAILGAVSIALNAMGISFEEQGRNVLTTIFMLKDGFANLGIWVANMGRAVYNGFANLINGVVNTFIERIELALNILGILAKGVDKVFKTDTSSLVNKLKAEELKFKTGIKPMEKKEYTEYKSDIYWNSVEASDKAFNKITQGMKDITGTSAIDKALKQVTENGALKTKQQGKMELKEEDIQMLNELATRDFMLRYQTLSPNINFGSVTVNENADFSQILGQINTFVDDKTNNSLNTPVGK